VGTVVMDASVSVGGSIAGEDVVVVTPRGRPAGWRADAPFHVVDSVATAVATAGALAGERIVEVAAGDVGGQVLAAANQA